MSCFSSNKVEVKLPDQIEFCRKPGTICGYLSIRKGLTKYEKRLAVLNPDGHLTLYKYYLFGVSAGQPLIGQTYNLANFKKIEMDYEKETIGMCIKTNDGRKLVIKVKGEQATAWASALLGLKSKPVGHSSHANELPSPSDRWNYQTQQSASGISHHNVSYSASITSNRSNKSNEFDTPGMIETSRGGNDIVSELNYVLTDRALSERSRREKVRSLVKEHSLNSNSTRSAN